MRDSEEKIYRKKCGFTNQELFKTFLGAKDVKPVIDYNYISELNIRLKKIVETLNRVVHESIKPEDINIFIEQHIDEVYNKLCQNNLLPRLNNQGRRPEIVYWSWMIGYVVTSYFLKALSIIFDTDPENIELIGSDSFDSPDNFNRTAKADIQLSNKENTYRIEVQTGLKGDNDVKKTKVDEAKNIFKEKNFSTVLIHFDLYNGQVAFIKLHEIENVNYETRQQLNSAVVFVIDSNHFKWRITEEPPKFSQIF